MGWLWSRLLYDPNYIEVLYLLGTPCLNHSDRLELLELVSTIDSDLFLPDLPVRLHQVCDYYGHGMAQVRTEKILNILINDLDRKKVGYDFVVDGQQVKIRGRTNRCKWIGESK